MTSGALPPGLIERARAAKIRRTSHRPAGMRRRSHLSGTPLAAWRSTCFDGSARWPSLVACTSFPVGSVDPADAGADVGWAGPAAGRWATDFATSEPLARSLVCAAVRETFEESGVLLAGTGEDDLLADVSSDDWETQRAALEARELSLSDLFARSRPGASR